MPMFIITERAHTFIQTYMHGGRLTSKTSSLRPHPDKICSAQRDANQTDCYQRLTNVTYEISYLSREETLLRSLKKVRTASVGGVVACWQPHLSGTGRGRETGWADGSGGPGGPEQILAGEGVCSISCSCHGEYWQCSQRTFHVPVCVCVCVSLCFLVRVFARSFACVSVHMCVGVCLYMHDCAQTFGDKNHPPPCPTLSLDQEEIGRAHV